MSNVMTMISDASGWACAMEHYNVVNERSRSVYATEGESRGPRAR